MVQLERTDYFSVSIISRKSRPYAFHPFQLADPLLEKIRHHHSRHYALFFSRPQNEIAAEKSGLPPGVFLFRQKSAQDHRRLKFNQERYREIFQDKTGKNRSDL